jgi:hypothetical protein
VKRSSRRPAAKQITKRRHFLAASRRASRQRELEARRYLEQQQEVKKLQRARRRLVRGWETRRHNERSRAAIRGWKTRRHNVRSRAAIRGWKTRRHNERSRAAQRGWETRRKKQEQAKPITVEHLDYMGIIERTQLNIKPDAQVEIELTPEGEKTIYKYSGKPDGWDHLAFREIMNQYSIDKFGGSEGYWRTQPLFYTERWTVGILQTVRLRITCVEDWHNLMVLASQGQEGN